MSEEPHYESDACPWLAFKEMIHLDELIEWHNSHSVLPAPEIIELDEDRKMIEARGMN